MMKLARPKLFLLKNSTHFCPAAVSSTTIKFNEEQAVVIAQSYLESIIPKSPNLPWTPFILPLVDSFINADNAALPLFPCLKASLASAKVAWIVLIVLARDVCISSPAIISPSNRSISSANSWRLCWNNLWLFWASMYSVSTTLSCFFASKSSFPIERCFFSNAPKAKTAPSNASCSVQIFSVQGDNCFWSFSNWICKSPVFPFNASLTTESSLSSITSSFFNFWTVSPIIRISSSESEISFKILFLFFVSSDKLFTKLFILFFKCFLVSWSLISSSSNCVNFFNEIEMSASYFVFSFTNSFKFFSISSKIKHFSLFFSFSTDNSILTSSIFSVKLSTSFSAWNFKIWYNSVFFVFSSFSILMNFSASSFSPTNERTSLSAALTRTTFSAHKSFDKSTAFPASSIFSMYLFVPIISSRYSSSPSSCSVAAFGFIWAIDSTSP